MRILIVTRFYKNGQTTHVVDLCSELIRQKHQVILIITHLYDPVYLGWLRDRKIPHLVTSDPYKLRKHIQEWRPQIIHNHSAHTLQATLLLGRELHIPTLTTVHYLDFAPRELLQEQDGAIFISKEMEEHFGSLDIPTFVVENGITIPQGTPPRHSWKKRALFLAQVTKEKESNFQVMAQSLLEWGWTITSAGNWRYRGINSLGWVNDVSPLLRQADLVVGTGRTVREGMAHGAAVWVLGAYSDGLVTPENVEKLRRTNFSGRTTREIFSPKAAALDLREPSLERFSKLGNFGRQYAQEHFSLEAMVKKLIPIYQAC